VGSRPGTELRRRRRACAIYPRSWMALSCRERTVFAQKPQGGIQLRLAAGETVWVAPEFITVEPVGSAEPPRDDPVDVLDEQDLGSDFEVEDPVPQEEEEEGGQTPFDM